MADDPEQQMDENVQKEHVGLRARSPSSEANPPQVNPRRNLESNDESFSIRQLPPLNLSISYVLFALCLVHFLAAIAMCIASFCAVSGLFISVSLQDSETLVKLTDVGIMSTIFAALMGLFSIGVISYRSMPIFIMVITSLWVAIKGFFVISHPTPVSGVILFTCLFFVWCEFAIYYYAQLEFGQNYWMDPSRLPPRLLQARTGFQNAQRMMSVSRSVSVTSRR